MIYDNILQTIGKTPLVRINRMTTGLAVEIFAKAEYFNPGGSVKDRIALSMIEDAEQRGRLKKGDVIIEPTSGNTGIGLALVAAVKGYQLIVTMPETMSRERRLILEQYGAKVILTPAEQGMEGAVVEAERLAREHGYFMPQQFQNPANPRAHRNTTAREIIDDLGERPLDFFVAGVGTSGTLMGTGEILKQHYPTLKVIAVEPKGSPVLSGGVAGPHQIAGIGAGFVPDIYRPEIVDEVIQVSDDEAFQAAKALARLEGLLVGISSGANMSAAIQIARRSGRWRRMVVMLCDTGERYISTKLFG